MHKRRAMAVAVLFFLFTAAYIIKFNVLIVQINGKSIFIEPVKSRRLHIRYYHSVSKTFIDEYYYLDTQKRLIVTKSSLFSSQGGAGLPEYGEISYTKDGRFRMDMSRPIKTLFITVQHQYPGYLYYGGAILNFPSYTSGYAQAKVFLDKINLITYVIYKKDNL